MSAWVLPGCSVQAVKEITGAVLGRDITGHAVHFGEQGPADLEEEQESHLLFARTLVLVSPQFTWWLLAP